MDVKEIKRLLDAIAATGVHELSYETGEFKLQVKCGAPIVEVGRGPANEQLHAGSTPLAEAPQTTNPTSNPTPAEAGRRHQVEVVAPIVGTFYSASVPDAEPFVTVGDRVQAGTILCIIEAMKLMNEIEAESAGTVVEVLVGNEDPVEYGQVLFRIEPV